LRNEENIFKQPLGTRQGGNEKNVSTKITKASTLNKLKNKTSQASENLRGLNLFLAGL